MEAIKMKESLSGKEVTTVDNSTMKTFVKKMIMSERASKADAEEQELLEKAAAAQPFKGVGDLSALLPTAPAKKNPLLEKGETATVPTEEITNDSPKTEPDAAPGTDAPTEEIK
jgi:hypothetical protein